MTELQMGLIGLGVAVVAGVWAYNKWQEARQRGQAENILRADHPDVLLKDGMSAGEPNGLPGEAAGPLSFLDERGTNGTKGANGANRATGTYEARVEPVLSSGPEPDPELPAAPEPPERDLLSGFAAELLPETDFPAESAVKNAVENTLESTLENTAKLAEDRCLLFPQVDFIVTVNTVEPAPAQRIADASREIQARVRKPVHWIGFDEASGEWQTIPQPISGPPEGEYRYIRAGLQLVNRQGAVGEDELAAFAAAMQDLADQLTGIADFPSRQTVFETAAALDKFCESVDIQIGINVISRGQPFAGTKLRALAEAAGMAISEDGRFTRRDDDGNVLYAVLNQEVPGFSAETIRTLSTRGLTFLLDVPNVAHGERVFGQMADLARRFADVLHGDLVDDNRRPLSDASLEPIRRQIEHYQALLAGRQLPPGSPLARRLFS